jgi:hypothetical protein
MRNRDEVGAASVDYLMYSGYVTLAYFWAVMADTSFRAIRAGRDGREKLSAEQVAYYQSKIKTARFYYKRILPRAKCHKEIMLAGSVSLMQLDADHFDGF